MAKPTRKAWPELSEYFDNYGLEINFDQIEDMRVRSDGLYVVCMWTDGAGSTVIADIASHGRGEEWEMQNDGDTLEGGLAEWKKLKIVPECDWWTTDGFNPLNKNQRVLVSG